jgi:hypothetical protein
LESVRDVFRRERASQKIGLHPERGSALRKRKEKTAIAAGSVEDAATFAEVQKLPKSGDFRRCGIGRDELTP